MLLFGHVPPQRDNPKKPVRSLQHRGASDLAPRGKCAAPSRYGNGEESRDKNTGKGGQSALYSCVANVGTVARERE